MKKKNQKEINEYLVSTKLRNENIGRKMYHHFIIEDQVIKYKICPLININYNRLTNLSPNTKYLSLIIMQKLDGYTLGNSYIFNNRGPRFTSEKKNNFVRKSIKCIAWVIFIMIYIRIIFF